MAEPIIPILSKEPLVFTSPPKPQKTEEPRRWAFSFRYWRQIENFGLDRTDAGWFASLLEKLSILSNEEVDKFICDSRKKDVWRYHNIDWGHKNIPIQMSDLDWLPSYCQNNPEYVLVQFQISLALGRVVGFWDKDYIFNIVLLDPFHNIQPSKRYDYRVDPCNPLNSDYAKLLHGLDEVLKYRCEKISCQNIRYIRNIPNNRDALQECNVLMVKLTDEDMEISDIIIQEGKACSLADIFKEGLRHLI